MNHFDHSTLKYLAVEEDQHGIVTIKANVTTLPPRGHYLDRILEFVEIANTILQRPQTKGIIYQSPFGEAEIDFVVLYSELTTTSNLVEKLDKITERLSNLTTLGKPTVGLLDGSSVSLTLSSLLWSDYRVATSDAIFGFPEFNYGLFPGFGAITRCTQLLGYEKAIPFLSATATWTAEEAKTSGLINLIATTSTDAKEVAKAYILNSPKQTQPIRSSITEDQLENALARLRKKDNGLIPAQSLFNTLIAKSNQLGQQEMLRLENKAWASLWKESVTLNMIRTFFYHIQKAQKPDFKLQEAKEPVQKIAVLGAGIMGSGIAYEAARAGIQVVLKDVEQAMAEQGKAYAKKLTDSMLASNKIDQLDQQALLDRIYPTADPRDLAQTTFIIEAVFENKELKETVTMESISFLEKDGVFASNTTSLPISMLASATKQPENYIGMHFFSPVDRMPLVEIIRGVKTSDSTCAKALHLAHRLQKIPIVVFDGPAFFTSRIFFNYLLEAVTMLLEGIPATLIEQEARNAGFAIGPLAVLDEISLRLMLQVYDQLPELHASQQRCYNYISLLVASGRNGRKTGKGFYDYDTKTGKKTIWQDPTLTKLQHLPSAAILQKRLLYVMALDSYRCLAEGVLTSPEDGDLGSVLGVGYAKQTGGIFAHIDHVGLRTFVDYCKSFLSYGEQWLIPESLSTLATENFTFYDGFTSNWVNKQDKTP